MVLLYSLLSVITHKDQHHVQNNYNPIFIHPRALMAKALGAKQNFPILTLFSAFSSKVYYITVFSKMCITHSTPKQQCHWQYCHWTILKITSFLQPGSRFQVHIRNTGPAWITQAPFMCFLLRIPVQFKTVIST